MFRGHPDHRGYADVVGPQTANLKWRYQLGTGEKNFLDSVAIAEDGTIYASGGRTMAALDSEGNENLYFTSEDGHLYAIGD